MILADVNPLIYAFRPSAPFHEMARAALSQARAAGTLIVLPDVAASFVRIVTDGRWQSAPDSPDDALALVDALTAGGRLLRDGRSSRWPVFEDLIRAGDLRGTSVPDGLIAATCLDLDAGLLTADRDFLRFSGLRVHLLTPMGVVDHTVT